MDDIRTFDGRHLECVQNIIGCGGMGVVSLYKWKVNLSLEKVYKGDKVAVKKLESASDIRSIKKEARILWRLHETCPFILRLFGLMISNDLSRVGVCLVLEYMQHGNISHFFAKLADTIDIPSTRLWPLKARIAQQVCDGMAFLHGREKPVLHCDLKAANVLLDDRLNVKICDFGLAKIKLLTTRPKSDELSKENIKNNPAGTVSHVAPELLRVNNRPTKKSDVYSFGIFLWELLTDRSPYEGIGLDVVIIKEVLDGKRPDEGLMPSGCPPLLRTIMTDSWQQDPMLRPRFEELRCRFQGIDNRGVEDAVAFALETLEQGGPSETEPKSIVHCRSEEISRGVGNCFQTVSEPSPDNLSRSLSRTRTNELCISKDESQSQTANALFSDCSHHRLLGEACIRESHPISVAGEKKTRLRILLFVGFVALSLPVATFIVGRYTSPSIPKGCCLQCFDRSDPGLQRNCHPNSTASDSVAPPGAVCNFLCTDGYVLNANATELKCGPTGAWSGSLPYCRKTRQCSPLSPPANGGNVQCTWGYYENSKCSFQCPDGYRLRLPGNDDKSGFTDDFTVTCQSDSISNYYWSGQEPYCEKIVTCDSPAIDETVLIHCPSSNSGDLNVIGDRQYHNGTICTFSCPAKMSLETNQTVGQCLDTGTWNTSSKITCLQECPYFPDPPKSSYNCTLGRKYNSRCLFSCVGNFVLVGSSNMVCQAAGKAIGKWVNAPPRCECPSCRSGDNCEKTVSFQDTWMVLNETMAVTFDGHPVSCSKISGVSHGCQCRDVKRNQVQQCNDPESDERACYKAYASLILIMSFNGTYTLPCDAGTMPKSCK